MNSYAHFHMFCAISVIVCVRGLHTVLLSILSFMKAQGRLSDTHKGNYFCHCLPFME